MTRFGKIEILVAIWLATLIGAALVFAFAEISN
jgi:hypothetical protein